jgi:hypothetical protein
MNKGDRVLLERQIREAQKEAIKEELERRIRDHAREVRRFERAKRFRQAAPTPLDLLAVGDSWFDYPLDGDFPLPLPPYDFGITGVRNLRSLGNPPPLVLSLAHYGWASTQVLTWENQEQIIESIQQPASTWTNGTGPDAILASFGGDDIAGDQLAIYLTYGGSTGSASRRFQGVLDLVQASYEDLFDLRNTFAPGVPIFAHCYDYAIPTGKPAAGLIGPWLKPSFDFALYDPAKARSIVRDMIDKFYLMLNGLASNPRYDFHVVDTRGTIGLNDWSNEIHPEPDGFYRLAQKFLAALQGRFPGRI